MNLAGPRLHFHRPESYCTDITSLYMSYISKSLLNFQWISPSTKTLVDKKGSIKVLLGLSPPM